MSVKLQSGGWDGIQGKQKKRSLVICDHIADMTDAFLLKTYERLFTPRMGSVFNRI